MTVKITKPEINIREKLTELHKPSGVAGEAMLRAETASEQQALLGVGRKNWIINGNHTINQRNNLPVTGVGTFVYETTDRWNTVNDVLSPVSANASLSDNALKVTVTSANASSLFLGFKQPIEEKSFLDGKVVTFSALVRSNRSDAKISIFNGSATTNYTSHSGNGNWERLVVTGVMTAGTEFSPVIVISGDPILSGGTSFAVGDYIEFKEAQLELGSVATPFEYRSYGEELALCQRYYYKTGTIIHIVAPRYSLSSGLGNSWWTHPVRMRAAPSMSNHGTWFTTSGYGGAPTFGNNTSDGVALSTSISTTANGVLYLSGGGLVGDAEL